MNTYTSYMDIIKTNVISSIKRQHTDWKIDGKFVVYREITPVLNDSTFNFNTKMLLRKRSNTSVLLEQVHNGRRVKQYFSDYNVIETMIFIYDSFISEGDAIYSGMCDLIKDKGTDVFFRIDTHQFSFKGIKYLNNDKHFLTFADYQIGINDFICLLNLIIEKERYSKDSENGKGTILKYILFLLLCSNRTTLVQKNQMVDILERKSIYKDETLITYKEIINATRESKLYFKAGLFENIL